MGSWNPHVEHAVGAERESSAVAAVDGGGRAVVGVASTAVLGEVHDPLVDVDVALILFAVAGYAWVWIGVRLGGTGVG